MLLKILGDKNLVILEMLMWSSAGTMKAASWLIVHWSDPFSFSCFLLRTSDAHEVVEGFVCFRRGFRRLGWIMFGRGFLRHLSFFIPVLVLVLVYCSIICHQHINRVFEREYKFAKSTTGCKCPLNKKTWGYYGQYLATTSYYDWTVIDPTPL